jgi:hypothetical protein
VVSSWRERGFHWSNRWRNHSTGSLGDNRSSPSADLGLIASQVAITTSLPVSRTWAARSDPCHMHNHELNAPFARDLRVTSLQLLKSFRKCNWQAITVEATEADIAGPRVLWHFRDGQT